jgi:hypothetical protein
MKMPVEIITINPRENGARKEIGASGDFIG